MKEIVAAVGMVINPKEKWGGRRGTIGCGSLEGHPKREWELVLFEKTGIEIVFARSLCIWFLLHIQVIMG